MTLLQDILDGQVIPNQENEYSIWNWKITGEFFSSEINLDDFCDAQRIGLEEAQKRLYSALRNFS